MDPQQQQQLMVAALMGGSGGAANMAPSAPDSYQFQMNDFMNGVQPSAVPSGPSPAQFSPQQLGYGQQQQAPGMFGAQMRSPQNMQQTMF